MEEELQGGAGGGTVNWDRVNKVIDPSEITNPCTGPLQGHAHCKDTREIKLYAAIAVPLSYREWDKAGIWRKHQLQKGLMAHEICSVGFGIFFLIPTNKVYEKIQFTAEPWLPAH